MTGLKEDTKKLTKEVKYVNNAMILQCQKTCFNYIGAFKDNSNPGKLNHSEITCLKRCLDQQIFFDNSTYEFDSAFQMATAQEK